MIPDTRSTDLFGNPVRDRKGLRGRPALEISPEDRDVVEAALVRGWTNERAARAVGISVASLKRHFGAALRRRDEARDRMEAMLTATLARKAAEGNVPAIRQLREIMEKDAMLARKSDMKRRQAEAEAAGLSMGKKAARQAAAEQAATEDDGWSDLLGERMH